MEQISKIGIRLEAMKIAASIKCIRRENVITLAKEIEEYITQGIELPDVTDPNEYMKNLIKALDQTKLSDVERITKTPDLNVVPHPKKSPMPFLGNGPTGEIY